MNRLRRYMTPFQWAEVLSIIGFTIYFAVTNTEDPWWYIFIDSVAAVCGVFCVVLCAAGKKSQYYWGLLNIIAYIVIAYINRYYGEVMLNGLYYLPTQFIGYYMWGKYYDKQGDCVQGLCMNSKKSVLWGVVSVAGIFLYKLVLDALGGNATLLDSMSNVFSIVANAMMVLRYREQWALWIVVDVVTVIMWVIAGDWLMTAMWSVYLVNAVYGLVQWTRMSRSNESA